MGAVLGDRGLTIAVAESLTGGLLASRLAEAGDASSWFRGGIVAYAADVKHDLLAVPDVPVVSEAAAAAMARSVRDLFDADVAMAVTGVGGPEAQDGIPAGTVWLCVVVGEEQTTERHRFEGGPAEVCEETCRATVHAALRLLETR